LVRDKFLARLVTRVGGDVPAGNDDDEDDERRRWQRQRTKERKDMRIPEVLLENFCRSTVLAGGERDVTPAAAAVAVVVGGNSKEDTPPPPTTSSPRHQRMEGDMPMLFLYNNFFVEGVRIGWPFPEVMKPQRQIGSYCKDLKFLQSHLIEE
jgi:hypothetical protein